MATTTTPDTGELRLVLDDILVGDNVRDNDQEHGERVRAVDRAACSAVHCGPTSAGYELVAGYIAGVVRVVAGRPGGGAIGQALREPGRTARRGSRLAASGCQRYGMVIAQARPSAAF